MKTKVFKRVEEKYLITALQYYQLLDLLKEEFIPDEYGFNTIHNIYFDTKDYDLIRKSLEKPIYKEKIRLRGYGKLNQNSLVFLEIKKKYNGLVGKRRTSMYLKDYYQYQNKKILPNQSQIMHEINYCYKNYQLMPKVYLAYDRFGYFAKNNHDFRITFDTNIHYRLNDLHVEKDLNTKLLINKETYLLEVKTLDAIPIWFSKILNNLKIYPISFSKYGEVYKNILKEGMITHV